MINRIIAVFIAGLFSASVFAQEPVSPKGSAFLEEPGLPEITTLENLSLRIEMEKIPKAELETWGLKDDGQGPTFVEHDGVRYFLEFKNIGGQSLTNLTVQYRCYYELGQSWSDELKNKKSIEFHSGEMGIDLIKPWGRFKAETEPFIMVSSSRRSGYPDTKSLPKQIRSKLVGLYVRVFRTIGGQGKYREFWSLSPSD